MTTEYIGQRPSFTALPNWLRGQATPLELAILWCLQSHYPNIHPSMALLAEEACLSRRSVSGVLAGMERKGWLVREHAFAECGRKASNRYRLTIWDVSWALVDRAGDALGQEVPYLDRAGGALGIGQEVHGDRAGGAHKEDQEKKNKKKKTYEPPLPPTARGERRPEAVAAGPCRDRVGFLIPIPEPQPPVAPQPPPEPTGSVTTLPRPKTVAATNGAELFWPPEAVLSTTPASIPTAVQPQQRPRPEPPPEPAPDPEAIVPVKPQAQKREAGFRPAYEDVPAALLPVVRELLAFWPARNPKAKRTQRAWEGMLTEAQKIQDHQQGGTEILREQLQEGAAARVSGPGWLGLNFNRWQQYGTKAGTPVMGSGFRGKPTTRDRVMGAIALVEEEERRQAARAQQQAAGHGCLALAEVA